VIPLRSDLSEGAPRLPLLFFGRVDCRTMPHHRRGIPFFRIGMLLVVLLRATAWFFADADGDARA
jgi:hypothetical protein